MKCPQCGFLCSDLRDVCGKCFVDLRPRKQELGIKIIRPNASYEELVAKVARKVEAQAETQKSGGLLGSFLSMLGSASQPAAPHYEAIERKDAPIEESQDLVPPQPPQIVTPVAPRKQPGRTVKFKRSSTTIEVDAAAIASAAQEPRSALPPSEFDSFATEELWGETYNAITFNGGGAEFEFQTSQLRTYAPEKEEIEILWALSDEAIQDPESLRRYKEVARSETRKIEAEAAAQALRKVEQNIQSQVFSLKRGGPRLTKQDEAQAVDADIRVPTHIVDPATRGERISAGIVDLGYIALLSFIFTFGISWFAAPELRAGLLKPSSISAPDLFGLGIVFAAFLLALGFFYPWFAGSRTAGQKLYGLAVIESTGRDATQAEIFLRSAMLPISAILGILFPPFWSELGFHNRLSNTVTTRLSAENQ